MRRKDFSPDRDSLDEENEESSDLNGLLAAVSKALLYVSCHSILAQEWKGDEGRRVRRVSR